MFCVNLEEYTIDIYFNQMYNVMIFQGSEINIASSLIQILQ